MTSFSLFGLSVSGTLVIYLFVIARARDINPLRYLKENPDILKGVVLALVLTWFLPALVVKALAEEQGTWLNDAGVTAGLEWTARTSPMCEPNRVDDRGTSNLGFWLNLYQSNDKNFRANLRYTHHSCALGEDDKSYDATGLQFEYKVDLKKIFRRRTRCNGSKSC